MKGAVPDSSRLLYEVMRGAVRLMLGNEGDVSLVHPSSAGADVPPTDGFTPFFVLGMPDVMHCSSSTCSERVTWSSVQSSLREPVLGCRESTVTASSTETHTI